MINNNFQIWTKLKTKNIIENFEEDSRIKIHDHNFSNEIRLSSGWNNFLRL